MPRPSIQTTVGDLHRIRHVPLGEDRPDEILADIMCPDCGVNVRWSNITEYPNDGIACSCPNQTWSIQAVTNIPRHGPPAGTKGKEA